MWEIILSTMAISYLVLMAIHLQTNYRLYIFVHGERKLIGDFESLSKCSDKIDELIMHGEEIEDIQVKTVRKHGKD